jgi:hypothetical protein
VPAPKKAPQTGAIFARSREVSPEADQADDVPRLSPGAKAAGKIGLFSQGGKSLVRAEAAGHDFRPDAALTPFGIPLPRYDNLCLYFTRSPLTGGFTVDVPGGWWRRVRRRFRKVDTLLINQGNGPESNSRRAQFVKRLIDLGRRYALALRLAYYPADHGKYNAIERCRGVLENHRNGAVLDSVETTLRFARAMTWKGKDPLVQLITRPYRKGARLSPEERKELEKQIERLPGLEKWFADIPVALS